MTGFRLWMLVGTGLFFLACQADAPATKEPEFARAFPNLPLPPSPEFVSRAGSADALQLTMRTPAELAQVTDYYRNALSKGRWRLVSDLKSPDGSTALYAEQDGPPLWVRIWKSSDRPGTMVQLTGAVTAADTLKQKRDTLVKQRTTPRT